MKISITGADGFVGASLCRYFHQLGHEIIAAGGSETANPHLSRIATYISVDITKPFTLPHADVCIHTSLCADIGDYKELIFKNVEGTMNVVEAAKSYPCFIHISSSSVYDFQKSPVSEEDADLGSSISDFGETRLLAEEIVEMDIPPHQKRMVLRPRAIYGIGDRVLLPWLIGLVKGRFLLSPFKKGIKSSLTHVDNLAHAINLFLAQPEKPAFQIFNVSDDKAYVLRDLALECTSMIQKRELVHLSLPIPILNLLIAVGSNSHLAERIKAPMIKALRMNSVLDISKIKRELKYRPLKDFNNSCPEIAEWVHRLGHKEGYLRNLRDAPWTN